MIEVVLFDEKSGSPLWIDVSNPTQEDLDQLKLEYNLHFTHLKDCVEVGHLPKLEKIENVTFLIVRAYDESSLPGDDNANQITQKIAFFLGDRFLITLHRHDPGFLREIRARYKVSPGEVFLQMVLLEILLAAVDTYQILLSQAEVQVEKLEHAVLEESGSSFKWEEVFRAKCRLSVTKRMLWHSSHVLQRFHPRSSENLPVVQDVRDRVESLGFFTDGLLEDINNLQNIQLSLNSNRLSESSNKTNEVVRLLTVFSLFFLPINFIASIYGMNFEFMPETKWKYGYFGVWGVIVLTVVVIYVWFRQQGWLQKADAFQGKERRGRGVDRRKKIV